MTKTVDLSQSSSTFTVLRAVESLEMDCDIDQNTQVQNMDYEEDGSLTIYGTQTNGQLYYLVLNKDLVDQIKNL